MDLTERQVSICQMIAKGRMDKEIADELEISEETVNYHLRRLYKIAKVRTRLDLAMWFLFLSDEGLKRLPERVTTRR